MEREPAELQAEFQKAVQFSFVHWGAICIDTEIEASMTIFDVEIVHEQRSRSNQKKNGVDWYTY